MISVEEAISIVLRNAQVFGVESVPLQESAGRFLAEDIHADRNFPPFHRVAMDGIALRKSDFDAGQRIFTIHGIQGAGEPATVCPKGKAIEIMTGAVLPEGADCVIRYEDTEVDGNSRKVNVGSVSMHQNVHQEGSDKRAGEILIEQNTKIGSGEIGILATVGKHSVPVKKMPSVAIISTGNELVEVHQTPLPHQIRRSNVHTLLALLSAYNLTGNEYHLSDDRHMIREKLQDILNRYDVVMLSGAVSKGKYDFLPDVLEELGVVQHFHRVAQRPGKPFWFGSNQNTMVFAFPGNPVSTLACAVRYFTPWLFTSLDLAFKPTKATLKIDVSFKPNLTYFIPVKLENHDGEIYGIPQPGNGSGDLANLTLADGFMELPQGADTYPAGKVFDVYGY